MAILIFLAGLVLYAGYGIPGFAYLCGVTVLSYLAGLLIPKYKWVTWVNVGLNALVLIAMKLQPVTGMDWAAPLGLSYFTLRVISYSADIYTGKIQPERNFLRYGLYVTYYPNISLGPIESYGDFAKSAFAERKITWDRLSGGGARILWGLAKKLIIASRAGVIISTISAAPETYQGAYALFAMLLYSVQLYADFSGGIDMVLGVSQMLGICQSENFDAPFFSQSVAEFWRRWHMTLGSWLRQYIYIPLGGNRKGKLRKLMNTLVTFLVSGLWHGVHYVFWGLFNGIFVALGNKLKCPVKLVNQLLTTLIISVLWAFFIWPETELAFQMIGSLFTTFNYADLAAGILELGLNVGEWIVLVMSTAILWICDWKKAGLKQKFFGFSPAGRVAVMCALALVILIFGMYGIGFNAEEFIYSKF